MEDGRRERKKAKEKGIKGIEGMREEEKGERRYTLYMPSDAGERGE